MKHSDRQPDLFGGSGFQTESAETLFGEWEPIVASPLSDTALTRALVSANLRDAPVLAAEAARRKLVVAVPALGALCRRFKGFSRLAAIPEQLAALSSLAGIGGPEAAAMVTRIITEEVVQGPGLPAAVSAAATLRCRLPPEFVLACLRDPRPEVRADACRLARASAETAGVLLDLLSDLHDDVTAAAACALARMGREEARPRLLRLLANSPSSEVIDAFATIADDDGIVVLGRLTVSRPDLTASVLVALEACDLPRAIQVATGIRRRAGL